MGSILKTVGDWLAGAIADKVTAPIKSCTDELAELRKQTREELAELRKQTREELAELRKETAELSKAVETKHKDDPAALECDLSLLDDRICYLIDKARERGYRTASETRRIVRMHDAYQGRGGNHGEEIDFKDYMSLLTEEEWRRQHGFVQA